LKVKGIGIDIFEKKRMKAALSRKTSGKILQKIFSASEIAAFKRSPGKEMFFSESFALKEAVIKAFGAGWTAYTRFPEVRVKLLGKKIKIVLAGEIREIAKKKSVKKIVCDYSVSPRHIVAVAVLVG